MPIPDAAALEVRIQHAVQQCREAFDDDRVDNTSTAGSYLTVIFRTLTQSGPRVAKHGTCDCCGLTNRELLPEVFQLREIWMCVDRTECATTWKRNGEVWAFQVGG